MEQALATSSDNRATVDEDGYSDFLGLVQSHFEGIAWTPGQRLFETDAVELWPLYLDKSPPGTQRVRTCNACRSFVQRYGSLVVISETGEVTSAIWPSVAPPMYEAASRALKERVERAAVTRIFLSDEQTWGYPQTGTWTHLAVGIPDHMRTRHAVRSAGQLMAERSEEFRMLQRSLSEFSIETVRKAHALLTSDALYRSEKVEGVGRWLLELHERLAQVKHGRTRQNLVWRAVANAPTGFCHVRSSMIGTLLEDIGAGLPFDVVKRKFAEKMNPTQYMRPQAPPSAGNIAQAEKVVAALQSAGALERRFAKLSDVQALWLPKAPEPPKVAPQTGVFGHLVKRPDAEPTTSSAPATVMTWEKFARTILPSAEAIEYLVPHSRGEYSALVTAKNADAPTMLQWDNHVSHYVYKDGSTPSHWNLVAGRYHRVTAVVLRPWMWDPTKDFAHHGAGVVFALEGSKDTNYHRSGGMFPEQMKSEYLPIRRTLEAYFAAAVIEGKDDAEACGISLVKGSKTWDQTFRVTSRGIRSLYKLDRWD